LLLYLLHNDLWYWDDASLVGGLPIGLAHGVKLKNDVALGQSIRWADVEIDQTSEAVKTRREMEAAFRPQTRATAAC
jgi:predicted homoserine dehydrogenase-like protein